MGKLVVKNILSNKKEEFIPIDGDNVGMYVCGPTLYSEPHIGNIRTFVNFDMIYRYLVFLGYNVKYVRNITDAGHITDSSGKLVDRMSDASRILNKQPLEIVYDFNLYFQRMQREFNLLPPNIEPTATSHIQEQIDIISMIFDNGLAYEVNGSVYFDVKKYIEKEHYGILSGRKVEDLIQESRDLEGQDEKRFFADFALWKGYNEGDMQVWDSPWGKGGPGWHIECTAMSTKYLGKQFDIHGGGMDLKFPHHEGEIAQSKASLGCNPANYWLYANMLTVAGTKMSKSLGNFLLADDLIEGRNKNFSKKYSANTIRFFMMMCHYASELDISDEALMAAEKGLDRMNAAFRKISKLKSDGHSNIAEKLAEVRLECEKSMNDDFNTAKALASLFELSNIINKVYTDDLYASDRDIENMQKMVDDYFVSVMGLRYLESEGNNEMTDDLMNIIIKLRNQARDKKDWEVSDTIRDLLIANNIQLKDGKNGTEWSVND